MINLRKAIKEGKLKQFIREHEKDEPGDLEKMDEAIKRPASEKSKEAPKASRRRDPYEVTMKRNTLLFIIAFCGAFWLSIGAALAQLTDSGPVTVASNGQVIENLRITSNETHGIECRDRLNVVIRNVDVLHDGGRGIRAINCDGITIVNVSVTHTGTTSGEPWEATGGHNNIELERSDGAQVSNVRVRGGATGIYLVNSNQPHLSFIEGYNMRGPFPRGQLVQFNKSPDCTLEDFYNLNDPAESWSEDNVNVYQSPRCVIRRGLVDGNTSPSGVGVMFEDGGGNSNDGRVVDVDAIRMGNGNFTSWGPDNIVFLRTRYRENICTDQGRGLPSSGGQGWVFADDANNGAIIEGVWFDRCWSTHWISGSSDATVDIREEDFTLRDPVTLTMPWEGADDPTVEELEQRIAELEAQVAQLESDLSASQDQVAALESEIATLRSVMENIRDTAAQALQ